MDSTPELLAPFAAMTQLHADLAPYTRALCIEARDTGLPLQRPLFLQHEDDMDSDTLQTHYLYGQDLLVAPVIAESVRHWRCYLPSDATWVPLCTGVPRDCDFVEVEAPFGRPPVFYRADSRHVPLFAHIAARHVARCKAMLA